MDKRPNLDIDISIKDFKDFYWLKKELVKFCRNEGLKTTGGKIEISQRIENFLKTGISENKDVGKSIKASSISDWNNECLSPQTKITDNYKNTENVRAFFRSEIGTNFKFNVQFMAWMKSNVGKTLKDAIEEWRRINTNKKSSARPSHIAPQFEYNTYLRDFISDNPNAKRELGIKLWKIKRSMRGDNKYRKSDLEYLDNNKTTQA